MTPDAAVVAVLAALDAAAIPYMIVGSLASNFHGVPRSTRDADFVVQLSPDSLQRLEQQLAPGLTLGRQGGFEAVTGTLRYLIALADSPFVCELFLLSDDAHDRERFSRRQAATVLTHAAFVATAEDMIVTKLRWAAGAHRSKDRDDIRNILAVQGSGLDWAYLDRWSTVHGTASLLGEIRASVPPNLN
ncbi:MAG: hypothetical protein Q7J25_05345 [Vicinamibacterales bacterium]|nr:hypothetical protein [Vicinamibacterales bacterium]